jgi:hypothetical protein
MPRAKRAKSVVFISSVVGEIVDKKELFIAVVSTGNIQCFPANELGKFVVTVVNVVFDSVGHVLKTLGDDKLEVRGFHSSIKSTSEVRPWILEAVDGLEYPVFRVRESYETVSAEDVVSGYLYIVEVTAFEYTAGRASVDARADLVT